MKVLVACEESGRVRDAFLELGHDAWSCDLLPTSSANSERHIRGDALDVLGDGWDLLIAHPPCTYLCNSGVRWLRNKDGSDNYQRWELMTQARYFFLKLWYADISNSIKHICVENPIPHRHAQLPKYGQIIQPWMFGDNYTKATCLWLKGLAPLVPQVTDKPAKVEAMCHRMPPGPDRARLRSQTYPGIALAMAEQWNALGGQ